MVGKKPPTLPRPRFMHEYMMAAIHVRLLVKARLTARQSSPEPCSPRESAFKRVQARVR
jgi:hypothetical protein